MSFNPIKAIRSNYKVLQKAIQNGEPAHYIIINILKKLIGYSNIYIPSKSLSLEDGYNIYLNKKYDKWETQEPIEITFNCCFIIIENGNEDQLNASVNSINTHASDSKIIRFKNSNSDIIYEKIEPLFENFYWIIILRAGDEIFPWTLARLSRKIKRIKNEKAIIFDHDIKKDNLHSNPHLKPFFNKRYLLDYDLIQNAICLRKEILLSFLKKENKIFDSIYSWLLDQNTKDFVHIQEPLLSLFESPMANYIDIINKKGIAKSIKAKRSNLLREISFDCDEVNKASIIIPFRDKPELLKTCVDSIIKFTQYKNYEIILADNNSKESETLQLIKNYLSFSSKIKHVIVDHEFNFSLINNEAVKVSKGTYLLFLNNDTEVLHEGWLRVMISELQQPSVGAVGPQLLYEDFTIQHAGVVPGIGHVAGHVFRSFPRDKEVAMFRIQSTQEVAAITGACLLTKKELFLELGGFDQDNLKIAYNDVDLCFKLIKLGKKVVYTPLVQLKHYESKSRKFDLSKSEKKRYDQEVKFMINSHSEILSSNQFYHPGFSKSREDYSFEK